MGERRGSGGSTSTFLSKVLHPSHDNSHHPPTPPSKLDLTPTYSYANSTPKLASIEPQSAFQPMFPASFESYQPFAPPTIPIPPRPRRKSSSSRRSINPPTPPNRSASLAPSSPDSASRDTRRPTIPPRTSSSTGGSPRPSSTYSVDVFPSSKVRPGPRPSSSLSSASGSDVNRLDRSHGDNASLRSHTSTSSLRSVNGRMISTAFPDRPSPSRPSSRRSMSSYSSSSSLNREVSIAEHSEDDDDRPPAAGRAGKQISASSVPVVDELSSLMAQMASNGSARPLAHRAVSANAALASSTGSTSRTTPPASPSGPKLKPLSLAAKATVGKSSPETGGSRRGSQSSTMSATSAQSPGSRRRSVRSSSYGPMGAPMMDRDATLRPEQREARFGSASGVVYAQPAGAKVTSDTHDRLADVLARPVSSAQAFESPVRGRAVAGGSGLQASGLIGSEHSLNSIAGDGWLNSDTQESPTVGRIIVRPPHAIPPQVLAVAAADSLPPLAPAALSPTSPYQMAAPVAEPMRIKSIEEIIRDHAGPSFVSHKPLGGQTPAQAVAASARAREQSGSTVQSSVDDSEMSGRSSVDSVGEEIKAVQKEAKQREKATKARGSIAEGGTYASPAMARTASQQTAGAHTLTPSTHTIQTPRQPSSPVLAESEAAMVERELATLLKSPRLTKMLSLRRPPNAGLSVSLADVGASNGHPVVVFLGLGCVRYLIALYDELATAFGLRLICVDRWGLGRTGDVPDEKRGFNEWATVLEEVVDQLGLARYSVLAHSAGAPYSLASALRSPAQIQGSIHLLAPWVSAAADSLAGPYKYLKYVPTGVIKTAQAAEWKMQAWRLGKPPTITPAAASPSAAMAAGKPSTSPTNGSVPSTRSLSAGLEDDEFDRASVRSNDSGKRPASRNGKPLKPKGSKSFLGGMFGGQEGRSLKASGDKSDANSLRPSVATEGQGRRSSYFVNSASNGTPSSSTRGGPLSPSLNGDFSPDRRASTLSSSSALASLSSSPGSSPAPNPPAVTLSGTDLANGLLRASHAESLHGSTSDLMVILARTANSTSAGSMVPYSEVASPVKVWWGDRDDRISLGSMRWLEGEVGRCEVRVVEGADHSLMTSKRRRSGFSCVMIRLADLAVSPLRRWAGDDRGSRVDRQGLGLRGGRLRDRCASGLGLQETIRKLIWEHTRSVRARFVIYLCGFCSAAYCLSGWNWMPYCAACMRSAGDVPGRGRSGGRLRHWTGSR